MTCGPMIMLTIYRTISFLLAPLMGLGLAAIIIHPSIASILIEAALMGLFWLCGKADDRVVADEKRRLVAEAKSLDQKLFRSLDPEN